MAKCGSLTSAGKRKERAGRRERTDGGRMGR